jgi:hypothetical protein
MYTFILLFLCVSEYTTISVTPRTIEVPSCLPMEQNYVSFLNDDRLCGLVVRVPGYITEMYCVSCEVRTEFIYVM